MHFSVNQILPACLALAALSGAASAAVPVISTNTNTLLNTTSDQQLQFSVTGSDAVAGETLDFQVNDGTFGPKITVIDALSGTIFGATNNGQAGGITGGSTSFAGHVAQIVVTGNPAINNGTTSDNGLLATMTLNSTGSGSFLLKVLNTRNGNTNFITWPASTFVVPSQSNAVVVIGSAWNVNGTGTWGSNPNWTLSSPAAAGDDASFLGSQISGIGTVTLDGPRVAGNVFFYNTGASYLIAPGSGGSLQLNNGSFTPTINDAGGNHAISAPVQLTANTIVSVDNISNTLTISGAVTGGAGLIVAGAGRLVLGGADNYAGTTTVNAGANVLYTGAVTHNIGAVAATGNFQVDVNSTVVSGAVSAQSLTVNGTHQIRATASPNTSVSQVRALTIGGGTNAWSGKLDVGNNPLILLNADSNSKATVLSNTYNQVKSGSTGNWTGTGITSTSVGTNANTTLAVVDAGEMFGPGGGIFKGTPVDAGAIIVDQALQGDADLNGVVDFNDLVTVAHHFNLTGLGWASGNFDVASGSNVVDFNDLVAVAHHFNLTFPLGPDDGAVQGAAVAQVPEPMSLALLGLGGAMVLTRRPRRVRDGGAHASHQGRG